MSVTAIFLVVNFIGGSAVLGGYLICLYVFPTQREMLWGNVQGKWRFAFTVSMIIAAVEYMVFSYGILFKSNSIEFS